MKKYFLFLILASPAVAWALGSWTFYSGNWYNSTTGQTLNLGVGTYPPGINTLTPTLTFTPTTTYYGTRTPALTATATPTGTYFTATNTPYIQPTWTQTPATGTPVWVGPSVWVGDSYTAGYDVTPVANQFAIAVPTVLASWFPGCGNNINYGYVGASSGDYIAGQLASNIANIPGYGYGSPKWIFFELGINNLRYVYNASYSTNTGPSCAYGSSVSLCQVASYNYQNELGVSIIGGFRAVYPKAQIVVLNLVDPSNGGEGPDTEFNSWTTGGLAGCASCFATYNQRVKEICSQNGYILIDVYSTMYGHPEWFAGGFSSNGTAVHPNLQGAQQITNAIIKKIGSPPVASWF